MWHNRRVRPVILVIAAVWSGLAWCIVDRSPAAASVEYIPVKQGSDSPLRLNEVLIQPRMGDAEWVEIINVSEIEVPLAGWRITTGDTGSLIELPPIALEPGGYY